MKCVFVVAVFFIAGTFAEVPFSKFKNVEYELTNPNADDYFKVFQTFGLDFRSWKKGRILTLDTPDAEGGEYTLQWGTEGDEPMKVEFTIGEENKGTVGEKVASYHFGAVGDKLVLTIKLGEKTMMDTFVFTDNQVTETAKSGANEGTIVYKLKKA